MTIQLTPEQERIIQEEIENGHFDSLDDVLDHVWLPCGEEACNPRVSSSSSASRRLSAWK